jgi:cytochrome c-type biogenesis protein CcsB
LNLIDVSSNSLLIAFIVYILAFIWFVIAITGKHWSRRDPEQHTQRWSRIGFWMTVIGLLFHVIYFVTRWAYAGRIPTSNMYEFMTFLGMMVMVSFLIIYKLYRIPGLGVFALPVGFIIIAYASVFPSEVQPLIPALQSYWLKIHVTTAATAEAFFAVGFAAGLMYLVGTVNYNSQSSSDRKEQRALEFTLFFILTLVAFISSTLMFNAFGYHAEFSKNSVITDQSGQTQLSTETEKYVLPPIVKPFASQTISMDSFLGITKPLFEAPSWMNGAQAGRKLNTVIWSILLGIVAYYSFRFLLRKPIGQAMSPIVKNMNEEDLDELGYRAIAIGYPLFTLGALIFAMIWAHEAWGRFWGWDPKEVWALITWLFYAVFLHLRLSRGWHGKKSAWLAVIGFIVVMFTLIGVNLVIAGLHSYAGV